MPFWHRIVIAAVVLLVVTLLARLVDWWLSRKTVPPEVETRYRVLRRAITTVIIAVGLFSAPSMAEVIVEEGWATRVELDAVITALREWGELPDAFASWLYCGALGWLSRE